VGVRVPPAARPDIIPDAAGLVTPGMGGMSVSPNWRDLPYWLILARLSHLIFGATGRNDAACFRMGNGPFTSGPVAADLELRVDGPTHGLIEPAAVMTVADYQRALAATRDQWIVDEK
jgi:hypothetical protein